MIYESEAVRQWDWRKMLRSLRGDGFDLEEDGDPDRFLVVKGGGHGRNHFPLRSRNRHFGHPFGRIAGAAAFARLGRQATVHGCGGGRALLQLPRPPAFWLIEGGEQ